MRTLDEPIPAPGLRQRLLLLPLFVTALGAPLADIDEGAFVGALVCLPLVPLVLLARDSRWRRAWQCFSLVAATLLGPGVVVYHAHVTVFPVIGEMPTGALALATICSLATLPFAFFASRSEPLRQDTATAVLIALTGVGLLASQVIY